MNAFIATGENKLGELDWIEEARNAKTVIERAKTRGAKARQRYLALKKEVKRSCRRDRRAWADFDEGENATNTDKIRLIYDVSRCLSGTKKGLFINHVDQILTISAVDFSVAQHHFYGISCTTFLAIRVPLKLADDVEQQLPLAVLVLRRDLNMYNLLDWLQRHGISHSFDYSRLDAIPPALREAETLFDLLHEASITMSGLRRESAIDLSSFKQLK